jgi:hypothetical protein
MQLNTSHQTTNFIYNSNNNRYLKVQNTYTNTNLGITQEVYQSSLKGSMMFVYADIRMSIANRVVFGRNYKQQNISAQDLKNFAINYGPYAIGGIAGFGIKTAISKSPLAVDVVRGMYYNNVRNLSKGVEFFDGFISPNPPPQTPYGYGGAISRRVYDKVQ